MLNVNDPYESHLGGVISSSFYVKDEKAFENDRRMQRLFSYAKRKNINYKVGNRLYSLMVGSERTDFHLKSGDYIPQIIQDHIEPGVGCKLMTVYSSNSRFVGFEFAFITSEKIQYASRDVLAQSMFDAEGTEIDVGTKEVHKPNMDVYLQHLDYGLPRKLEERGYLAGI